MSRSEIRPFYSRLLNYPSRHRKQLVRFLVVGLITFIIYFALVYLFYSVLNYDYKLAVSIAYVVTVICHFTLHRIFTFDGATQKIEQNAAKYLLMLGINYIVTLTVVWLAVQGFHYSPYLGALLGIIANTSSGFFIMKYFVFSPLFGHKSKRFP